MQRIEVEDECENRMCACGVANTVIRIDSRFTGRASLGHGSGWAQNSTQVGKNKINYFAALRFMLFSWKGPPEQNSFIIPNFGKVYTNVFAEVQ